MVLDALQMLELSLSVENEIHSSNEMKMNFTHEIHSSNAFRRLEKFSSFHFRFRRSTKVPCNQCTGFEVQGERLKLT